MKVLMTAILLGALLFAGCSEQTQQQVQDASQSVAEDAKKNLQEAAETTEEAAADAQLTASIKSALMASEQVGTDDLNVDSKDGEVFLRGRVDDEKQKSLAEEITRNTAPTGTKITNELTVGPDDDSTPSPDTSETPAGSPTPAETP